MKFDYEEIGTFNATKAAEGLVELAMNPIRILDFLFTNGSFLKDCCFQPN